MIKLTKPWGPCLHTGPFTLYLFLKKTSSYHLITKTNGSRMSRWLRMDTAWLLGFAAMALIPWILPAKASAEATPRWKEKIVFSGSSTYAPLQWVDDRGRARGFIIDLQERMGRHGGVAVEQRLGDWQDALRAVELGEADAITLFASAERKDRFDFTLPFYHLAHGIFSHSKGEHFRNLAELNGRRVAVVIGSYAANRLIEEKPGIEVVPVKTEFACIEAVHTGVADACIEVTLTSRRNAVGLSVEQTSAPFWHLPYVFGVRKGNTELLNWLEHQLAGMQADGTFFSIYRQWKNDLEWHRPTIVDHLRTVALIAVPLFLLALIGLFVSWHLKRQVERRTRELRYQAEHDALTGLHNAQTFVHRLEQRLRKEPDRKPTVAFLRLQNLEIVTSLFGPLGHRKLIKDFAQHLQKLDFILTSHFGFGFFTLAAQPGTSPDRIFDLLSMSSEIDGIHIDPAVVMGLSSQTAGEDPSQLKAEELVRRAITAYYMAPVERELWRTYAPQLEPDPKDLILLHDAQRHGTRDMELLYQPKLDLASGYVREAEALLRWHHPKLGMVSAGHFIPLLEKAGLIRKVTRWVIEEGGRELARCRRHDAGFGISVNISAGDLVDGDLLDFVGNRLDPGVRGGLCFEVTETGIINNPHKAQEVITAMRKDGIRFALDDFGTGYSCLNYLSRFDIEEVKLDRSFVRNILDKSRDHEIVRSMIDLAHTLGLKVTAEGIEDEATLQMLVELGCDMAQGYVIGRPMKARELYQFMGRRMFPGNLREIRETSFKA